MTACLATICVLLPSDLTSADALQTAPPAKVKRIPPPGIDVPPEKRSALQQELDALAGDLSELEKSRDKRVAGLLPDVRIYWQAVQTALADHEFYAEKGDEQLQTPKEIDAAFELLRQGRKRAAELKQGSASWSSAKGLVARGYVSRLDGSVQPYGLVIPASYSSQGNQKYRLDLWFHGRNEKLSEVNFLRDREKNIGTFAPRDAIVLHPYGRYCNANKLAGEVDVYEAIESVRQRYPVDEDRIVIRGFSMGGASTWHLAVHNPSHWAAANPGAGFAETPIFARLFHHETLTPTWWETKLFHLYDCTNWAGNLWHCPTVAYSGEIDSQKQAADIMAEALKKEGLSLVHVIGPKTPHRYEPQARDEVERQITALAEKGRDVVPEGIHFTTYTLRYNHCGWITVDALDRHWEPARLDARPDEEGIAVAPENIQAFTIAIPAGYAPLRPSGTDGVPVRILPPKVQTYASEPQVVTAHRLTASDRSWTASFHREGKKWVEGPLPESSVRKKHGLQGPIDDAFMDSFLFVRPTAKCANPDVDAWVHAEMERAMTEWRRQFRGIPRVKDDKDVNDADVAAHNLIVWGDSSANSVFGRIADKLPIRVQGNDLVAGDRRFAADHHVPILIYPNPLNPQRYVVLNSGFTFREHAQFSNAYQIPKLPDWAIVDIRTPPNSDWPGKIVAADFFDELWELGPPHTDNVSTTP